VAVAIAMPFAESGFSEEYAYFLGVGRCPNPAGLLNKGRTYRCVSCKSWACEHCSIVRARSWLARASRGNWTHFWSLTVLGDGTATQENIRALRYSRKILFAWVSRNLGRVVNKAIVLERGDKHGRLHAHILLQLVFHDDSKYVGDYARSHDKASWRWFDWKALQAWAKQEFRKHHNVLGALDFQPIWTSSPRAYAGYVVPYLRKQVGDVGWPRGTVRAQLLGPDVRDRRLPTEGGWRFLPFRTRLGTLEENIAATIAADRAPVLGLSDDGIGIEITHAGHEFYDLSGRGLRSLDSVGALQGNHKRKVSEAASSAWTPGYRGPGGLDAESANSSLDLFSDEKVNQKRRSKKENVK
jgi:hypothetical protein